MRRSCRASIARRRGPRAAPGLRRRRPPESGHLEPPLSANRRQEGTPHPRRGGPLPKAPRRTAWGLRSAVAPRRSAFRKACTQATSPPRAALDARGSSAQQEAQTSASQVAAWRARATADGRVVPEAMVFLDGGARGAPLVRPARERLRDVAAAGGLARRSVPAPARLARNYAHQVLSVEELRHCGVEVVSLHRE
jgi:hypothetical protein